MTDVDQPQGDWERLGSAWNGGREYQIWKRSEAEVYNLTDDGPPGEGDGGYGRMESIMKLKGCNRHDVVGRPSYGFGL